MSMYNGFTKAKKTQIKNIVIASKTITMRIKWDSEWEEYQCNVKFENDSRYHDRFEYLTSDWQDAARTVEKMAYELIGLAGL